VEFYDGKVTLFAKLIPEVQITCCWFYAKECENICSVKAAVRDVAQICLFQQRVRFFAT